MNFLGIAVGAWLYGKYIGFDSDYDLTWNESFLLSSVLAGSDEVSAMSLVRIKDYPRMGALIFGEGVINDALSIVLFKTFLPYHTALIHDQPIITTTLWESSISIFSSIVLQLFLSLVIAMVVGLANARLLKSFPFFQHHPIHQTSLVLLFGYLAYGIAEATGVSGILTLFITAVILAHYSW